MVAAKILTLKGPNQPHFLKDRGFHELIHIWVLHVTKTFSKRHLTWLVVEPHLLTGPKAYSPSYCGISTY